MDRGLGGDVIDLELNEKARELLAQVIVGVREAVAEKTEHWLQNTWGRRIFQEAQDMVPEELGAAQASGQLEFVHGGFRISYGGEASAYVEYQHEEKGLQHRPPTTRFTYEGPFGQDRPGAWNPVGAWKRFPGAIYGKPIEYRGGEKGRFLYKLVGATAYQKGAYLTTAGYRREIRGQWRFVHVGYSRRSDRADHPIKAKATHHWLFGEPHSAFDSNKQRIQEEMNDLVIGLLERVIRHAA